MWKSKHNKGLLGELEDEKVKCQANFESQAQTEHPLAAENRELKDLIRRYNQVGDNHYSRTLLSDGSAFKYYVEYLEKKAKDAAELEASVLQFEKVLSDDRIIGKVQQILTERGYLPKVKK